MVLGLQVAVKIIASGPILSTLLAALWVRLHRGQLLLLLLLQLLHTHGCVVGRAEPAASVHAAVPEGPGQHVLEPVQALHQQSQSRRRV